MRNQKFIKKTNRDVAQFGSAHGSGARGNRPIPFSKKHENGRKTAKTRDYASLKIRTSAFDHNFDQNWEIRNLISELIGVWHSLVVRMVREQVVAPSSHPQKSEKKREKRRKNELSFPRYPSKTGFDHNFDQN